MTTQELLKGLESGWEEATVGHKFIKACVDGSIKPEQFNTWLTQVCVCVCVQCITIHLVLGEGGLVLQQNSIMPLEGWSGSNA
jgi:hypothetical protein